MGVEGKLVYTRNFLQNILEFQDERNEPFLLERLEVASMSEMEMAEIVDLDSCPLILTFQKSRVSEFVISNAEKECKLFFTLFTIQSSLYNIKLSMVCVLFECITFENLPMFENLADHVN